MKIPTTITAEADGACIFEADVICHIDAHRDRYGELEWIVDQYVITDERRVWDDTQQKWRTEVREIAVPERLAEVFDHYLNKRWMAEQIHERLMEAM